MCSCDFIPWLILANLIFWLAVLVVVFFNYPNFIKWQRRRRLARFMRKLRKEYDTGIDEATDVTSTTFVEWDSDWKGGADE